MAENEIRCFGPPGTGKTTWVAERVRDTAKSRGTERIIACSFTKAAAAEIGGRDLPIPDRQIGTLHSLAYRAIDRPTVADERIEEWNKRHPEFGLSRETQGGPEDRDAIEGVGGATPGDELLRHTSSLRARLVPEELWNPSLRRFWLKWCEWKSDEQLVDYTDMIDFAIQDTDTAPGDPLVGFFDEVQDFTPLELKLVRHWGRKMDRVILAGDDDQCIYSFKGASPSAFLEPPVGDDQKRMLEQSYRVPRSVHAVAKNWIEQLEVREPKNYHPRDEDGTVTASDFTWQYPQDLGLAIGERVEAGQSVMILTSTSYMLDPIKKVLRDIGLPYHNPYRRRRGDWNPLKVGGKRVSSADRLLAFLTADPEQLGTLAHPWTGADLQAWTSIITSKGVLVRGAKQLVQGFNADAEVSYEQICSLFADPDHLRNALEVDLPWFRSQLLASKRDAMAFPLAIADRHGAGALLEQPKVTIGTIHSVKGGQADAVYLFPDLSAAGYREWALNEGSGKDAVVRLMYVGMTRARQDLIFGRPTTQLSVPPELMMEGAI